MNDDINKLSLPWTGERYVPEIEGQIELEHLHRYLFAAKFVQGKNVLDIASGEGYGSAVLASKANHVIGVDISEEAVNHARSKYQNRNIEFRVGPADSIPVESNSIDVVVSFETIEHHDKHKEMMSEIKRVLKPDGILIMSSPDKYFYSVVPNYSNPYHVKELFKEEFKELLGKFFKNVRLLGQRVVYGSVIVPEEGTQFIFQNLTPEREEAGLCKTIYDIAVASDNELPVLTGGLFEKEVFNQDVPSLLNYLASCEQAVAEREEQINNLAQLLADRDEQITRLNQAIAERDEQITKLNRAIADRDNRIEELNQAVAERAGQITNLTRLLSDREEQMSRLNQLIFERDRQIAAILNSRSWQFSKPLRWFGRFIRLQKFRYLLIISKFKGSKFGKLLSNLKNYSLKVEGYVKAYGFLALLLKVRERIRLKSSYTNKNSMIEIPKIKLMNIKDDDLVLYPNSTVSVIIPTKNAGNEFHYLLTMLQNQEGIQDIEIIVVDSGSTDETVEVAKKAGAKIIEIPPESFSHSYSRNLGAEHARGDYLLFMTQDALPSGNRWIYQLISFVKTNDVAAVSCVEFPREDCDLIYRVLLWNHARFLEVDKGDRILAKPQKENSVSLRKNGQLSDVACLIKKNVFQKFKYRYDYGEDLDLGIRLIRDNYKIGLLSSTVVIHSHNREPFYYLKRWYVETQALNKILPDTAILKINCEELINNVLFAFYKLNYLTEMLSTLRVPTTVRLLEQTVCEVLDSPNIDVKYIDIHSIEKNKYIDSNFKLFLQQIYSTYPNPETGNNGLIITKTKAFLELVLTFMNNIYTHVDEVILGEFISCMYKAYGLILGECLAYCYLNTTEATDNLLKNINDDLRKGV